MSDERLARISELGRVHYIYEPHELAAGLRDAAGWIAELREQLRLANIDQANTEAELNVARCNLSQEQYDALVRDAMLWRMKAA